MDNFEYEKVDLSKASLEASHSEIAKAQGWVRYAKFKGWLHYANLRRWRDQGLHFHYSSGPDVYHCTCGLTIESKGVGKAATLVEVPKPVAAMNEVELDGFVDEILEAIVGNEITIPGVELDAVQRRAGHRNLPSARGVAVALIVSHFFDWGLKSDFWDAICQVCHSKIIRVPHADANHFVITHNKRCKRKKRSEKK